MTYSHVHTSVLGDLLLPTRLSKFARDAILVLGGSWVVAAFAQISFQSPWSVVPFTGQTLAVLLVSGVLGGKRGASSLGLYLAQGAVGLPFFAGGRFGLGVLSGATAGYLVGFVLAAAFVGAMSDRARDRKVRTALPVFLGGSLIIFFCGVLWLAQFIGWSEALRQGFFPFIPWEIVKFLILGLSFPALWRRFGKN